MRLGFRVFFVDREDRLHRIPFKRFEQLVIRPESNEAFPEFAGQRVRSALVILELRNGRPVGVKHVSYAIYQLDKEGRLDEDEQMRGLRMAVDSVKPSLDSEARSGSVVDAGRRFAKKRYRHEFMWQPSPGIEREIAEAIFGRDSNTFKPA